MATAVVHYSAAAVSDRGRKRPSNEDAFGYSTEHGVYLVCDGMGGAAAGEIASSLAVDEFMRLLTSRAADVPLQEVIDQAILTANEAIYSRSQANSKLSGMGTTMVALVVEERRVRVLNIGDSRCYRLRGGHLEQISQSRVTPDIFELEAEPGDLFLLCSDGLTRELPDPRIESILTVGPAPASLPLEALCCSLVEAANQAGGGDNITCLLLRAEA